MSNNVVVIAPHPDDETLGCGGTLLKHRRKGDRLHWIIVTHMSEEAGYSPERIKKRNQEINEVRDRYEFESVHNFRLVPARLDHYAMDELVKHMSEAFRAIEPEIVYLPYRGDIHTDHAVVSDAVLSCTKWFRYPSVNRILVYETPSETDFGLNPDMNGFRPNLFSNISEELEGKINMMKIFASEMGEHPFPRSEESIRALATVRGAASGFKAAEAFMLIRERWV